jgi:hypothetical protein
MLQLLRDRASGRKLRLFAVACRRAVSHLDGISFSFKETPEDQERYADDPTTPDRITPATDLASAANEYAQSFAWAAHFDPKGCSDQPFAPIERSYSVEQAAQCVLLRDIFGNPFRPVSVEHSWLTPTVAALAQATYLDRHLPSGHLDVQLLAVLADALEDAGCTDQAILNHLRTLGPHVRGCWAVDLALARE